ncbi:MAG: response regulator [Burkholderiales bacterium]|nr:response regulator [Burkholderiales bacterium]
MTEARRTAVMVVEDDPKIARLLVDYLENEGLAAIAIGDGLQALRAFEADPPSALVLDLMLPGLDGLALCRAVRATSDVPIVMLTARIDEIDRLIGLEVGADDYVCKPFSPREVVARVKAQLRRAEGRLVRQRLAWEIDEAGLRIAWRGHWLPLTPLEFRMFRLLLERPGRVFARAMLLDAVHADLRDVSDRAIDSHVKNLRRKIEAVDPGFEGIVSVYGVGYRFDAPAAPGKADRPATA